VVGEGDFAGVGDGAAADERLRGGRVMGHADGALVHQGDAFGPLVHTADNLDDAMRFVNDAVKNAIAARAA